MSGVTTVGSGSNFLHTRYNLKYIFLGNNSYNVGTLANTSGGELTYKPGTLLGRVTADGTLVPLTSAATDGSQIPVGVLAQEITVADSDIHQVTFCVAGRILKSAVVFQGTDTEDTVVSSRRLIDRIVADTQGIQLLAATELSVGDNDLA